MARKEEEELKEEVVVEKENGRGRGKRRKKLKMANNKLQNMKIKTKKANIYLKSIPNNTRVIQSTIYIWFGVCGACSKIEIPPSLPSRRAPPPPHAATYALSILRDDKKIICRLTHSHRAHYRALVARRYRGVNSTTNCV